VTAPGPIPFNHAAEQLRQCALLLERRDANPFRVKAYWRAAQTLESLATDARTIVRYRGRDCLTELPYGITAFAPAARSA
jgi:DNA polymerase/3'-5' exonuclease PolX